MKKWQINYRTITVLAVLTMTVMVPPTYGQSGEAVAVMNGAGSSISLTPLVSAERFVLTVSQPDGTTWRQEFGSGETPSFQVSMDGSHTYELRGVPAVDEDTREILAAAREQGDTSVADKLRAEGRLPAKPIVQSGSFVVVGGAVADSAGVEASQNTSASQAGGSAPGVNAENPTPRTDDVINDSLCVGLDCPATPAFGFTTLLMMENNLRIKFDDTSNTGSFPNRDWTLAANDSTDGGANRFYVQDCGVSSQGNCAGNIPFTIQAGARNNAVVVESTGDVGFGTATPAVDLHYVTGNTPTLRLDQDGSSGFAPQTWDVAGNEAGFFIRDVTNGSTLPFRIRPGAPSSSIDISAGGLVGIGTGSPEATLDVSRSDGTTRLQVNERSTTVEGRTLFDMYNNGDVRFFFTNEDSGDIWQMSAFGTAFQISSPSTGRGKFRVFKTGGLQALDGSDEILFLDNNGNLEVTSVTETSSRFSKSGFQPVDSLAVLDKVSGLPLSSWTYKNGDPTVRHLGPMAEDFHAAFGLGKDNTGLTSVDTAGVAFAAIQGLNAKLAAKDARIEELESRLARLEALIGASGTE